MKKRRLRANRVAFYVNDTELELLQQNAESCNMSVSEFLRNCIVYKAEIEELQEKEKTFVENFKELQRVGVNLNQLTRSLNKLVVSSQDKKSKGFFMKILSDVTDMGIEMKIRSVLDDMTEILKRIKGR